MKYLWLMLLVSYCPFYPAIFSLFDLVMWLLEKAIINPKKLENLFICAILFTG
jgi:hypothetical protein